MDHYIGLDWAQKVMAVARLSKTGKKSEVFEYPSDVKYLKDYLKKLHGKKLLTLEESTAAQWLYVELKDHVDELIVCDPRRNSYLSEGAKTDKKDAIKLAELARCGMLKSVYHSGEIFISFRKFVSGYEDVIKSGVRWKNQRSAIFRALGKDTNEQIDNESDLFVLNGVDEALALYESERRRYVQLFKELCKKHKLLSNLRSVPGLRSIGAVKVAARVVNPRRFSDVKKFWAYCGLIKYEKMSGGKSYGQRRTNYCRVLKDVIGTAALVCTNVKSETYITRYHRYLIETKRYSDHVAINGVRRHIAALIFGVMKSGKKFDEERISRRLNK